MRSKTTMVSWMENDTEVRMAVTKRVSTSATSLKWPTTAQMPARTKTSWSSLNRVQTLKRVREIVWVRKRKARYTAMSTDDRMTSRIALRTRSVAIVGPTVWVWTIGAPLESFA